MKKIYFILFLLPLFSFSQNYQTINPEVVSYFEPEEEFEIPMWFKGGWSQQHIRCINIIEQETIAEGTLYTNQYEMHDYNYELMHWYDGPCVYLDMPSWVGEKILIQENPQNIFFNRDNDSIVIKTMAQLNDAWKFYQFPDNSYFLATINQMDTMSFLGIVDSVKFIFLEYYDANNNQASSSLNGTELRLSKNHGFIKVINFRDFPEFTGYTYGILEHNLVGQTGTTDEYHKMTRGDIYNFNIGDEFHRKIKHEVIDFSWTQWKTWTIIDKIELSSETVQYNIHEEHWGFEYYPGSPMFHESNTVTKIYEQLSDPVSNHLPFEPYEYDENVIIYNVLGIDEYNNRPRIITTNDTYSYWDDCFTHDYFDSFGWLSKEYIKGCGNSSCSWTEDGGEYYQEHTVDLVYFKKGEETWGTPLTPPQPPQEYIPFPPEDNSEWRVDTQTWNPDPWQMTTRNKKYYFSGDTTIFGNTYHKLYSKGLITTEYSNGSTTVSSFGPWFEAGIRNAGSKVFINYFDEDILLFDYNIQVGDAVPECFINMESNCDLVVISIDSVLIGNRIHKRYNFANPELANISWFIEGIGHEYGIFERACMGPDFSSSFLCYAENEEPLFPDGVVCDLTVNMKETKINSLRHIFPNPASNIINISTTKDQHILRIQIFNLTGHKTLDVKPLNNSIDISNLPPGLYLAEIKTSEGDVIKKIVVQ